MRECLCLCLFACVCVICVCVAGCIQLCVLETNVTTTCTATKHRPSHQYSKHQIRIISDSLPVYSTTRKLYSSTQIPAEQVKHTVISVVTALSAQFPQIHLVVVVFWFVFVRTAPVDCEFVFVFIIVKCKTKIYIERGVDKAHAHKQAHIQPKRKRVYKNYYY